LALPPLFCAWLRPGLLAGRQPAAKEHDKRDGSPKVWALTEKKAAAFAAEPTSVFMNVSGE
jgi:hypothetical protein